MKLSFLVLSVLMLTVGCATPPDPSVHDASTRYARAATQIKLSDTMTLEISPEIELLTCVLSQTSWMKTRGPQGRGNAYFQELQALAAPFGTHPAVINAERLTHMNFTYDAPPNFILRTRLPEMTLVHGYDGYLIRRAQGVDNLDRFRTSLRDFAAATEFRRFYNNHVRAYRGWLVNVKGQIDAEKITGWLSAFFGKPGGQFHIVLAPAMPSQGGYGFRIETPGSPLIYQVIRERGTGEGAPEFFQWENELNNLTIHEFSHSFVNPAVEKWKTAVTGQLTPLYRPVEHMMRDQAYGSPLVFFYETIVRAVTIMCMDELFYHSAPFRQYRIEQEENIGFYLVRFTMETLTLYQNSRGEYKSFDAFLPLLLKSYKRNMDVLLTSAPQVKAVTGSR
jgi:hypothetical protein